MTEALGRQAIAKVSRRLLPFIALLYFVNFLDRINLGFAALTMNKDLGLSAYVYGLGAGIFFFGYFYLRGAKQSHPGAYRRASVDRPHHADLGLDFGRHGVCHG
jgi:hypothetical protein